MQVACCESSQDARQGCPRYRAGSDSEAPHLAGARLLLGTRGVCYSGPMAKTSRTSVFLAFCILIVTAGLVTILLLMSSTTAIAQDTIRVVLPEVAIPTAKCSGTNACFNVDQSNVSDGSCIGDYSCFHNSTYTGLVNPGSCNGYAACQDAAGSIGAGSCVGSYACRGASFSIANNSCNGNQACERTAGSIGVGSCNRGYACQDAAGTIGINACNGTYACERFGGSIGAGSCNGTYACERFGGSIGAGSCIGDFACFDIVANTITIDLNSCNSSHACDGVGGSIGANSCNGYYGCFSTIGTIGTGSCTGYLACYFAGGQIGNNSCNTTGRACQTGGTFPVGDCLRNDVLHEVCIVSRLRFPLIRR